MAATMSSGSTLGGAPELPPKIHEALQLVHNPYSSNDSRREAQEFLELVKSFDEAPLRGYELAADRTQSFIVRHYALSLIEHAIKHRWAEYTEEQSGALRGWVLALCQAVNGADPGYIRTKTVQLWIEVAKRSWGAEWMEMDELLVQIWHVANSPAHKELVLSILETLSEEVFSGEDPVVAIRETILSRASVEIFTPAADLLEAFPNRQNFAVVRCGEEGWLGRVCHLLRQCLGTDLVSNHEVRVVTVRGLAVLTSLMTWLIPRAVVSTGCIDVLTTALSAPHVAVQKAALEVLHVLYSRTSFSDRELTDLVLPMFRPPMIDLYRRLVKWSSVSVEAIDDDKYQFAKKFSEMLSCLGNFLERRIQQLTSTDADVEGFMDVLLSVVQSESSIVSIPVLVSWNRLLIGNALDAVPDRTRFIAPLLELCGSRMIRYENLSADAQDPTFLFLMEDTDTAPERHAFLGNYRRYATGIIQSIVQMEPSEVLHHVLTKTEEVLAAVCDGQYVPNKQPYSKHSYQVLRVDAQLSVLEAAFKGYMKWRKLARTQGQPQGQSQTPPYEAQRTAIELRLESWCNRLLEKSFDDPQIRKRVLQLLVFFSTTALDKNAIFMLKVLEYILMTWPALEPQYRDYNESIKELQSESTVELQRLALEMPDHLLNVYNQLESRVQEMVASGTLDEKRSIAYRSFLFIIIHRANTLEPTTKVERLRRFVAPVLGAWQSDNMKQSLSTFDAFCELLGLNKAQSYLANRNVYQLSDWGAIELDAEGLALQEELESRIKELPLRATKSLLMNSVERLDRSSPTFQVSQALWEDGLPIILSDLLQLLSHAHASHNPDSWTGIPPESRSRVVARVLSDRFWQAGISDGSKDDFYARVVDKKGTLEGLASSIRGSIRFVRETSYALLCCMSRFDVLFYGFSQLPMPLSQALFTNSGHLSAHQHINLLQLVKYLTDDVPPELREGFLPPILGGCFQQMDAKIRTEWERIDRQQNIEAAGDDLQEEMKAESILRQASHTAVLMVAEFLDPNKQNPPPLASRRGRLPPELANDNRTYPTLRRFCLLQSNIVEPLMLFATHAIRIRDQRSCSIIIRVFRSIISEFVPVEEHTRSLARASSSDSEAEQDGQTWPIPPETATAIREYISSDVLQACVSSFHDSSFVDLQKELAILIAQIVVYYGKFTDTSRKLLLSIPNVNEQDLNRLGEFVDKPTSNTRQQRAIVLDLLKDVKGISISEMGKVPMSIGSGRDVDGTRLSKRNDRSKMTQQFMENTVQGTPVAPVGLQRADEGLDALDGVSNLFDD